MNTNDNGDDAPFNPSDFLNDPEPPTPTRTQQEARSARDGDVRDGERLPDVDCTLPASLSTSVA